MGFCSVMVRAILIIFNLLFLLAGLLLIGFGAAMKIDPKKILNFFTEELDDVDLLHLFKDLTDPVSIIMIVLGCVMFLIALLGFLGAITLKKLFLVPYIILTILILLLEIVLIVLVVVLPKNMPQFNIDDFKTQDSVFFGDGSTPYSARPPDDELGLLMYTIQNKFACCGWTKDTDFKNAKREMNTEGGVPSFTMTQPSSCCKMISSYKGSSAWNTTKVFVDFDKCKIGADGAVNKDGCLEAIFFQTGTIPIIIVGVTLGLEVILIICAIVAACYSSKESV